MVWGAAGVHEGLRHHGEAGVHNVGLAQVEHEVRVLDQVHPEPDNRNSALIQKTWDNRRQKLPLKKE